MANFVFIAVSLDGLIADRDNGVQWLDSIPAPESQDMGFGKHMDRVDALVMGRNTYELVVSFEGEWPYDKPVFVVSTRLKSIPERLKDKVKLIAGTPDKIVEDLAAQGYNNLYIDGGKTIQGFLQQDLIDEMVITTIPIILGGGISLFAELEKPLEFRCAETQLFSHGVSQSCFIRQR